MRRQRHQAHVSSFRADRSNLFGEQASSWGPDAPSQSSARGASNNSDPRMTYPSSSSKSNSRSGNATAMEAAGIQMSLERTQLLLKQELERVSHVASTIDQDGKLLDETTNLHQQMNVKGAKKALSSLERAQQRQRRVLQCSLVFFWTVVFYIAWERVLTRLPFVDRVLQAVIQRLF
jgi:Sec20